MESMNKEMYYSSNFDPGDGRVSDLKPTPTLWLSRFLSLSLKIWLKMISEFFFRLKV